MAETTLDVAKKCPKCDNYGDLVRQGPTTDPRYTGHIYKCKHKLCLWYDTTWVVTVDEDGKVPVMDIGHTEKVFPKLKDISSKQRRRIRETFDDE